jgi:hypothetical protein
MMPTTASPRSPGSVTDVIPDDLLARLAAEARHLLAPLDLDALVAEGKLVRLRSPRGGGPRYRLLVPLRDLSDAVLARAVSFDCRGGAPVLEFPARRRERSVGRVGG